MFIRKLVPVQEIISTSQKVKPNSTLVYDFEDAADPNFHYYWKIEVSQKEDLLSTYSYDSQFKLLNKFVEVLDKEGATLKEYTIVDEETASRIHTTIINNEVYKWKHDSPLNYSVEFVDKGQPITVKKERTFLKETISTYDNQELTTRVYRDNFTVNINKGEFIQKSHNVSYYAENIGLIKFEVYFNDTKQIMVLKQILNPEEFERMVKKARR